MDTDENFNGASIRKVWMSIPTLTKYRKIYLEGGLEEYYKLRVQNPIIEALKSLGVLNNKHIPEVYQNSRDVRLKSTRWSHRYRWIPR
jgi:hypothetical protein